MRLLQLLLLPAAVGCGGRARAPRQPVPVAAGSEAAGARVGRVTYGVVEHRDVDLRRVRLRLLVARHCRDSPKPTGRGEVLLPTDAQSARCRLQPFRGTVALTAHDASGEPWSAFDLQADRDGVVEVEFARIDAALREQGKGGLERFARVAVGDGAWAGSFDVRRLRAFRADWHLRWIAKGRGSPGLFAALHPNHPRREEAAAMAVEARIARQQSELEAVKAGDLPARVFLNRHAWSPFRGEVEALLNPGAER